MRIGLNTPDPQPVSAEQATKSSSATTNQTGTSRTGNSSASSQDHDTVTLSALSTQALGTPDLRQGLIERLKQSISSGQYTLDPHEIAESMLSN